MRIISAVCISMFLLTGIGLSQYKLEYKATGSTSIHYKAHTTLENSETMMGQEQKVSVISDQYITVNGVNDGEVLLFSTVIDSGENLAIMPTGDTNRTPAPSMGKVKETRIRADGEELSSKWADTAFANSQSGQMKELSSFFFKLPSSSVGVGATWSQEKIDTVNTPGSQGSIVVNTNTTYTLVGEKSIDGIDCVQIQFTGKVKLKGAASVQGMDLAIDGSGTIDGTSFFDYNGGKVVKITGTSNQDLVMASSGENAMTIPMNQQTQYELAIAK